MPSQQLTLFFASSSGFGWTETYNTTAAGSALAPLVQSLINARALILGEDCSITRTRLRTGTKRQVIIGTAGGGTGVIGSQHVPTCSEEVALECLFQSNAGGFNRKFIRGIPEAVISSNQYIVTSDFDPYLRAYLNLMKAGQFNVVGRLNTAGPKLAIQTITPTPPRGFTMQAPGLVAPNGSVLRLSQVAIPGYNNNKVVQMQTAGPTTLFFMGGAAPAATPPLDQGMVQLYGLPYDNTITAANISSVSRRAAGRPFGPSRGRRPTLYSLRR